MATNQLVRQAVSDFLDKNADRIGELYHRWQDEKEYEDFCDYSVVFEKMVAAENGFAFITAKQAPFSFDFRVYNDTSFRIIAKARSLDLYQLSSH